MSDMTGEVKSGEEFATDSAENNFDANISMNNNTNGDQQTNGHNYETNGNDLNGHDTSVNGTSNGTNQEENTNETNGDSNNNNHESNTNGDSNANDSQSEEPKQQNGTDSNSTPNKSNNTKEKLEPEVFRKVFVGSLSYSTTDDSLRSHFCQFGELVDSVIMKESKTGKSRGFGFVTYKHSSMVDEMMRNRPHKLDGRELEVKRATPREESGKPGAEMTTKKLFVGGLREGINEEMLKEYFVKYGKIEDCIVMKEKDSNKSRGFGFVTFEDYDSVDKVVLEKFHVVNSQNVAVKKALPKDQTGPGSGVSNNSGRNHNSHSNRGHSNRNSYNSHTSNGRNHRNNNNMDNHNGFNNHHHSNNGYNNHRYNDYDDEFNSNNFNDDGAYNNFSNNHNSMQGANGYPPMNGMNNNNNNNGMPGMAFTNLALMAQKMLQAANMGPVSGNFGTNNGAGNFSPSMSSNGNGFNNMPPSGPGLLGPGDRNHSMNNGFNRNGSGGPIRSNGNGNRRPGPYNGNRK